MRPKLKSGSRTNEPKSKNPPAKRIHWLCNWWHKVYTITRRCRWQKKRKSSRCEWMDNYNSHQFRNWKCRGDVSVGYGLKRSWSNQYRHEPTLTIVQFLFLWWTVQWCFIWMYGRLERIQIEASDNRLCDKQKTSVVKRNAKWNE